MTTTEFQNRLDYFTNLLGIKQVKVDEGIKWAFDNFSGPNQLKMKKAFIYLNTLSRYSPGSSNSITECQVDRIFTQLEKLLPC